MQGRTGRGNTNTSEIEPILKEIAKYLSDPAHCLFTMDDDEASDKFGYSTWIYKACKSLKLDEPGKVLTQEDIFQQLKRNNEIQTRRGVVEQLKKFLEILKEENMRDPNQVEEKDEDKGKDKDKSYNGETDNSIRPRSLSFRGVGSNYTSIPVNSFQTPDPSSLLIEDNRIREVNFSDMDIIKKDAPSLGTLEKWSDIPNFAIITGANGTGKTHLLSYLERMSVKNGGIRRNGIPSPNVLYRPASDQNRSFQEFSNRDTNYYITNIDARNELISQVKQYLKSGTTDESHENTHPIYLELIKKASEASAEELADDAWWTKKIESCRDYNLARHDVNEPVNIIYNVLSNYHSKKKVLKEGFEKIESLKKLRKHYEGQGNDGNGFYEKFIEDPSFKKGVINSYLKEVNPSPKDEINKVLSRYRFKHEIKGVESNNEKLVFGLRGNKASKVSYYNLSSGEKVAIDIMAQLIVPHTYDTPTKNAFFKDRNNALR
jgi:hypothetical protein